MTITRSDRTTNSGRDPEPDTEGLPAPTTERRSDGQHTDHWILSDEERALGFVRPVRRSYRHVGLPAPLGLLRDLTDEERASYGDTWAKFEEFTDGACRGRFWTQAELDKVGRGCGTVMSMPQKIAETYAAQPHFYGSTFCCGCGGYIAVGHHGEFVWEGTSERVGT